MNQQEILNRKNEVLSQQPQNLQQTKNPLQQAISELMAMKKPSIFGEMRTIKLGTPGSDVVAKNTTSQNRIWRLLISDPESADEFVIVPTNSKVFSLAIWPFKSIGKYGDANRKNKTRLPSMTAAEVKSFMALNGDPGFRWFAVIAFPDNRVYSVTGMFQGSQKDYLLKLVAASDLADSKYALLKIENHAGNTTSKKGKTVPDAEKFTQFETLPVDAGSWNQIEAAAQKAIQEIAEAEKRIKEAEK